MFFCLTIFFKFIGLLLKIKKHTTLEKKLLIFTISLLLFVVAHGQDENRDTLIQLSGQVKIWHENKAIPFVSITNKDNYTGTITDTLGLFSIDIFKNDTIRISCIGFETTQICYRDSAFKEDFFIEIFLKRKIYQLSSIDIKGISWKQFKEQIINTQVQEDNIPDLKKWIARSFDSYDLAALQYQRNPGGVVIPISFGGKKAKQQKKLQLLKQQAKIDKIIEEKYNVEIIKKNTNLDDDRLIRFIDFCNFSRVWLLRSNGYDIIMEIRRKYNQFKNFKPPKKNK